MSSCVLCLEIRNIVEIREEILIHPQNCKYDNRKYVVLAIIVFAILVGHREIDT